VSFQGARPGTGAFVELAERMRARREEIEEAVLARVYAISDPADTPDPSYAAGLRVAVGVALDYGLSVLASGVANPPPVPVHLLGQARLAARCDVGLDTVLRRYFAGYALLGDFLVDEAEAAGLGSNALKPMLRAQASLLDTLVAAATEEFSREQAEQVGGSAQRHFEQVRGLLDGALPDTATLVYDFDASHLGMVASGPGAAEALRERAAALDCSLLLVTCDEETAWAWLGTRRGIDTAHASLLSPAGLPARVALAVGEPARGMAGWRLTHRQARAALPVAQRTAGRTARYAEVALLASALQDDVLTASLRRIYLAPLGEERSGGATARETLRAYFAADCNISSAAAALAVHRDTVANRLRAIEAMIGRPPGEYAADLELALRLDELDGPA